MLSNKTSAAKTAAQLMNARVELKALSDKVRDLADELKEYLLENQMDEFHFTTHGEAHKATLANHTATSTNQKLLAQLVTQDEFNQIIKHTYSKIVKVQ